MLKKQCALAKRKPMTIPVAMEDMPMLSRLPAPKDGSDRFSGILLAVRQLGAVAMLACLAGLALSGIGLIAMLILIAIAS
jgi:hypothetical protein